MSEFLILIDRIYYMLTGGSAFTYVLLVLSVVFALSTFYFRSGLRAASALRFSHKVAILGYPRSGKTTLIATLLFRILSSEIARRVRISGQETIDRISKYNEIIRAGRNLGPSTDKDVFSYRFQYESREPLFFIRLFGRAVRQYDVEVADFPGEYSREILDSEATAQQPTSSRSRKSRQKVSSNLVDGGRLYDLEYHSWISQADKYLILIDVADLISRPDRSAEIRARIFSAVMYLKESSIEDSRSLSEKPVMLVFTKSDILALAEITSEKITQLNYKTINNATYDAPVFEKRASSVISAFEETRMMLESNFSSVKVVFHSSYMRSKYFSEIERDIISFIVPGGIQN